MIWIQKNVKIIEVVKDVIGSTVIIKSIDTVITIVQKQ